jgi:thymidylate kinase
MDSFGDEFFKKTDSMVSASRKNYIDGRLPLIIDGTGRNYERIEKCKKDLESLGYECGLLMVMTDLETAKQRNRKRERSVDDDYLIQSYNEVMSNYDKFKKLFGNHMFSLNNTDGGNIKDVEKKIMRFINTPVNNEIANAWINQQKGIK